MSASHAVWTVLAAAHLALTACWASGRAPLSEDTPLSRIVSLYGSVAGADKSYGFFAADCGPALRAVLVFTDESGHQWTDSARRPRTREADIRLGDVISSMVAAQDVEHYRSCAAALLARHPTAVSVEIRIENYEIPSLAAFRSGQRPQWIAADDLHYTFRRAAVAEAH